MNLDKSVLDVAVYGAAGFIGSALVRRLIKSRHKVRSIARKDLNEQYFDCSPSDTFSHHVADLNDVDAIVRSLQGVDVAVQLMGSAKPSTGKGALQRELISELPPQIAFMEACHQANVQKIVFLSSGGTVYGHPQILPIPETHPRRPINSYGIIKATIENYLQMFQQTHALGSVVVRLANPFGPGQSYSKGQGLIPAILMRHFSGEPIHIFGDGSAQRDYLYINDTIDAIMEIISRRDLNGATINVGSGVGRSILDVIGAIESSLGGKLELKFLDGRPGDVDKNILDIKKAKNLLGWKPVTPFQEAVSKTVDVFVSELKK